MMQWAGWMRNKYPELDLLHHVPNGGMRSRGEAGKLKTIGVKRGVPDLFLPIARCGFHGLFVELKAHGGKVGPSQVEWITRLIDEGYAARVCWGADEAIQTIENYLKQTNGSKSGGAVNG